jgi:hypothetical protein
VLKQQPQGKSCGNSARPALAFEWCSPGFWKRSLSGISVRRAVAIHSGHRPGRPVPNIRVVGSLAIGGPVACGLDHPRPRGGIAHCCGAHRQGRPTCRPGRTGVHGGRHWRREAIAHRSRSGRQRAAHVGWGTIAAGNAAGRQHGAQAPVGTTARARGRAGRRPIERSWSAAVHWAGRTYRFTHTRRRRHTGRQRAAAHTADITEATWSERIVLPAANRAATLRTATVTKQPGRSRGCLHSQGGQAQHPKGKQFFHGTRFSLNPGRTPPSIILMVGVRP